MGMIVLPDHKLIRHPDVVLNDKCPTFYADGGFSRQHGDVMRITFYREADKLGPAHQVLRVMMGTGGFRRSMVIEVNELLPLLNRAH